MNFKEAKQKAKKLISQMTIEEKTSQLCYDSPAIERLGIHEYNWWNEAAHGVARAGTATVFPQAIALAATFNSELVYNVADAVSTEGRAKYNKSVKFGDRGIFKGLTYWAPNINIFRDPRWGRGQETFGEDPFLTATMATQYISGLQGKGEFLKSAACAKHFAVHSGPEKLRHSFNAKVTKQDLWETYLPAFEWCVKSGVAGVMGAYNRTNGEPCCASPTLMKILRELWGFEGYFVSDCSAINDFTGGHNLVETMPEAAALALNNGCNLSCGNAYQYLMEAYELDLITEDEIENALEHVFAIRYMLGEFEENRPYSDIPFDKVDCEEHRALNLEAARECLVLLENKNNYLPLKNKDNIKIAVVGPNANSITALEGNYNGHSSKYFTVADGIRAVFGEKNVRVANGFEIFKEKPFKFNNQMYEGAAFASEADLTILCLGYDRTVEGEHMNLDCEVFDSGDRRSLKLPELQQKLAEKVCENCENFIVVLMSGSAIDIGEPLRKHAKAVIQAWYPGALGGLAVAQLIAGEFSPSGRLPVTFYNNDDYIPDFCDYSMDGRTYRYIKSQPLYPFGYGLSFTNVEYSNLSLETENDNEYILKVTVENKGDFATKEKLQVYAKFSDSNIRTPNYQLCSIACVPLNPKESKDVKITVNKYWLMAVDENGNRTVPDGELVFFVGSHQPDDRSCELCGSKCLELVIK
ncbi:MAG: glycoside hydrolase family 3 C-terminal domain-containing protein [Acutalibacteraceae bacterium]|jgi:beta-glucosidase